jgi:hypothetical protein
MHEKQMLRRVDRKERVPLFGSELCLTLDLWKFFLDEAGKQSCD